MARKLQEVRIVTANTPPTDNVTRSSHKGQLYLDSVTGLLYRAKSQGVTEWERAFQDTDTVGTVLAPTSIPRIYEIR